MSPSDNDTPPSRRALDLIEARSALQAGEPGRCLDLLVARWGEHRHAELAAAIERASVALSAYRSSEVTWADASRIPRPSQVGPLLATLAACAPDQLEARVLAMRAWAPDPRIARTLLSLPAFKSFRVRHWGAVYDALVPHVDPRQGAELERRRVQVGRAGDNRSRQYRRVFPALCERLETPPERPLTSREVELFAEFDTLMDTLIGAHERTRPAQATSERALVEAIAAAPGDDGPRLVYADFLQGRGDPRGEFIALDVALARGARVKGKRNKAFRAAAAALPGPLAPMLAMGCRYERGMLTVASVQTDRGALRQAEDALLAMFSDLRWATVRTIMTNLFQDLQGLMRHAPLLSLRSVGQLNLTSFLALRERAPQDALPVTNLSLVLGDDDGPEHVPDIDAIAHALPRLRRLRVASSAPYVPVLPPHVLASPLIGRLQSFEVTGLRFPPVPQWLANLLESEYAGPEVYLYGNGCTLWLRRADIGGYDLDLSPKYLRAVGDAMTVETTLQAIPRDVLRSVRVFREGLADELYGYVMAGFDGLNVVELATAPTQDSSRA